MKRFNPDNFYSKELPDNRFHETIRLKQPGIELIAEYLNIKYGTHISCSPCFLICAEEIHQLSIEHHKQAHYRHAFIVQNEVNHAVLLVYVKEHYQEVILYSDAKGYDGKLALKLAETIGLPFYASRQEHIITGYLSHINALVFARDITRMDTKTVLYYMSNLIETLNKTSRVCGGYKDFMLPNKLLKTTQSIEIISNEVTQQKIHKNETLAMFQARYSYGSESTYLQEKSMKYADIIKIIFYLNAIEQELECRLAPIVKHKFIIGAKNTLTSNNRLHEFAEHFLSLIAKPSLNELPSELLYNSIFYKKTPTQTDAILPSCILS